MKIGILGLGVVGQTLAIGFIKHGHQVMVGSRTPQKLSEWKKKSCPKCQLGIFEETAAFGELLVLAAKGSTALETLKLSGDQNLKGKIILDATNPISDQPPKNGVLKFFTSLDRSLMEDLQMAFPETRFVKAFNSIGSDHMVNPRFSSKPSMFICGNDPAAKEIASKIIQKFGFEVEDMGSIEAARAIEPLCMLWCIPGFLKNQWSHAFKLLKK